MTGHAGRKVFRLSSLFDYGVITAGAVLTAAGIVFFLTPARIAAGGVSGLSIILYHVMRLDPGLGIFLLSIPIFILGVRVFGRLYGVKSLLGTILLSAFVSLLGRIAGYEGLLPYADRTDILLSALYGGVLTGVGLGIIMKGGANTGGTDILAQVLHHYSKIPLGTSLMLVDGAVILIAGFVFGIESLL